ncbi:MAG: hypothetical protein WC528_03015 [Patescibacteria group bacterium]
MEEIKKNKLFAILKKIKSHIFGILTIIFIVTSIVLGFSDSDEFFLFAIVTLVIGIFARAEMIRNKQLNNINRGIEIASRVTSTAAITIGIIIGIIVLILFSLLFLFLSAGPGAGN